MLDNFNKNPLQYALFKAAKVGNINLMRDFLVEGADPFALDEDGHDAIFYANLQDPENTATMLLALQKAKEKAKENESDE